MTWDERPRHPEHRRRLEVGSCVFPEIRRAGACFRRYAARRSVEMTLWAAAGYAADPRVEQPERRTPTRDHPDGRSPHTLPHKVPVALAGCFYSELQQFFDGPRQIRTWDRRIMRHPTAVRGVRPVWVFRMIKPKLPRPPPRRLGRSRQVRLPPRCHPRSRSGARADRRARDARSGASSGSRSSRPITQTRGSLRSTPTNPLPP